MVKISSREYCSARSAHEVDPAAPGRGQCERGAKWVQKKGKRGVTKKREGSVPVSKRAGVTRSLCSEVLLRDENRARGR
jgi:hypothetical protein